MDALSANVLHNSLDQFCVTLEILDDMGIGDDILGDGSLLVIRMDIDVLVEIIMFFGLVHSLH